MLQQKISDSLKEFLKAGKSFEAGVLRMLLSAVHNKEIEKRGKGLEPALSEEEITEVLAKEAKKRKEAVEIYSKAGRDNLAEKEAEELKIVKFYLPPELNREEIEKAVERAVKKTGASGPKDIGKAMGEAMKELKGRAEAGTVSEIVRKKLE